MAIPGDKLPSGGPGIGTYIDVQGDVRASVMGTIFQEGTLIGV
jgi:hypothetical protein